MQRCVNREKAKTHDFTWKPNLEKKNHGEEGENLLLSRGYNELNRANTPFTISDFDTVLLEVA